MFDWLSAAHKGSFSAFEGQLLLPCDMLYIAKQEVKVI